MAGSVEMHSLNKTPSEGSFVVAGDQPERSLSKSSSEGAVLVVDDQPKVLERTLPRQLLALGYSCDIVVRSSEALELIQNRHYVGGLLDYHLDADDPYDGEFLAMIMREVGFNGFLFSFSSEDSDTESIISRRIAAGMDDVLGKPFRSDKFKSLINTYFSAKTP